MLIVAGNNTSTEINHEQTRATNLWNTNDSSMMNQLEIYDGNVFEYEQCRQESLSINFTPTQVNMCSADFLKYKPRIWICI